MSTIAAQYGNRDQALRAVDALREAGFTDEQLTIVASPTSGAEMIDPAARALETSVGGYIDFGAAPGGQQPETFPQATRRRVEAGIAQNEVMVKVEATQSGALERAEEILRNSGALEVLPSAS